jgi:hypothetical protein
MEMITTMRKRGSRLPNKGPPKRWKQTNEEQSSPISRPDLDYARAPSAMIPEIGSSKTPNPNTVPTYPSPPLS